MKSSLPHSSSIPTSSACRFSGSHVPLAAEVVEKLRAAGLGDIKVVAGGIIPPEDEAILKNSGVSAVFSPKDYDLNTIMRDIVHLATD